MLSMPHIIARLIILFYICGPCMFFSVGSWGSNETRYPCTNNSLNHMNDMQGGTLPRLSAIVQLLIQNAEMQYAISSFLRSFADFPLGSGVQCNIFS